MHSRVSLFALLAAVFAGLILTHLPFLHLPYYWDEAGYFIPAALDFYHHGFLIPRSTLPSGHTPLVMVYLGAVWRIFGFSQPATRVAMLLISAAAVVTAYTLARRVSGRETGIWAALLLAISPLFFAQSTLVFLDLAAALFTAMAVLFLLEERWTLFVLAASCAVMSKETACVMLPVMWGFMLFWRRERRWRVWIPLAAPIIPLAVWALFYHHRTGFWTGNAEYLQYNFYSALAPLHILRSFAARLSEVFIEGFNWLLTAGAVLGIWWVRRTFVSGHGFSRADRMRKRCGFSRCGEQPGAKAPFKMVSASARLKPCPDTRLSETIVKQGFGSHPLFAFEGMLKKQPEREGSDPARAEEPGEGIFGSGPAGSRRYGYGALRKDFNVLSIALIAGYVLMLSFVGGAVLARYMLPALLLFIVLAAELIGQLPRGIARVICVLVALCFVGSWFINPPYPFPYENNLAYADFIHLHQQAADYLESVPGNPVVLTAWPATDELRQPFLGYVRRPLRVAPVENFTAPAFKHPPGFDLLYLYSRKWQPAFNLLLPLRGFLKRFYGYQPQIPAAELAIREHLKLIKVYNRGGQWVRIYCRARGRQR